MKTKKTLKFWNGRGHGKYDGVHMYVCAYSQAEASRLLQKACETNFSFITELRDYYGKCWGNDMAGIIVTSPCVYITNKQGSPNPKCILGGDQPKPIIMNQSEQPAHTKGEWRYFIQPDLSVRISGKDTFNSYVTERLKLIAILNTDNSKEDEANAQRIVKAVNMHDELIKAMQNLLYLAERMEQETGETEPEVEKMRELLKQAEQK